MLCPGSCHAPDNHDLPGCHAAGAAGLHAFPFHVVSVVLHALVSMMVLGLAQHLFAKLELVTATAAASEPTAASAEHHHGCGSNSSTTGPARRSTPARLHGDDQPALWLQPRSQQRRWQAVLAALLFALHPIHTEVGEDVLPTSFCTMSIYSQAATGCAKLVKSCLTMLACVICCCVCCCRRSLALWAALSSFVQPGPFLLCFCISWP